MCRCRAGLYVGMKSLSREKPRWVRVFATFDRPDGMRKFRQSISYCRILGLATE